MADDDRGLTLLVRAGELFHQSLDVAVTLENVARMATESFADLCLVDLLDVHSQKLYVTSGSHRNPTINDYVKGVGTSILYDQELGVHPVIRVVETGKTFFVPAYDEDVIRQHAASSAHADFMRTMRYASKIVVAVSAHGRIFGAITFVRTENAVAFDRDDVAAAEELGRRAGLAVANARQYERELQLARTLQRTFLSDRFPKIDGLAFSATYIPAEGEAEIGGDWYDVFAASGGVFMVIGDVAGKGSEAARLMVQLRQSLRVAAILTSDVGEMLSIANRALLLENDAGHATAFVALIGADARRVQFANAGHPPPAIRWHDGGVEYLSLPGLPLGVYADAVYETREFVVDRPATFVLYTDGVIEYDRDAIAGEAQLTAIIDSAAFLHSANPARFVQKATAGDAPKDDVAVLTARFGDVGPVWRFNVADSAAAYASKNELIAVLREHADLSPDEISACSVIFSELVGNAVRYAPGALSISLATEGGAIDLHVIDEGPGFDRNPSLPDDIWAESGRGLFLVAALSGGLHVERAPHAGSHVRVRLPIEALAHR